MKAYFLAVVLALGIFGVSGHWDVVPSGGSVIKPLDHHGTED
ncbi:hypothetical protein [Paenibacillus elgii]|nr:hypothetical protein [Paenibacillus elgii]